MSKVWKFLVPSALVLSAALILVSIVLPSPASAAFFAVGVCTLVGVNVAIFVIRRNERSEVRTSNKRNTVTTSMVKPIHFYMVMVLHLLAFSAVLVGIFVRSSLSNIVFVLGVVLFVVASVVSHFLRRRIKRDELLRAADVGNTE